MDKGFNLLKQQVEPPTVWTKIYEWIVGSARLVVIVIEAIVVIAFGIRLFVDVKGSNLDKEVEKVENQVNIFDANGAVPRFREIISKTYTYKLAWEDSILYSKVFAEVNSYIPASFNDGSISIEKNAISIQGKATVAEIGVMEKKFKNSPTFQNTELSKFDAQGNSPDQQGEFILNTSLKEPEYRKFYKK